MSHRPSSQSFRAQLGDEWRSATAGVHKYKRAWSVGFVLVSLGFAVIAGVVIRPSLNELPLVLLAGFLHSLQYLSVLAFVWFWVIAWLTYRSIHNWAESRWVDQERLKRPNKSFSVPFWRFKLLASFCAMVVFSVLCIPLAYILFVLPRYSHTLDRALSIFNPGGG